MNELTHEGKGFESFLVAAISILASVTLFGFIYLATTSTTTPTVLPPFIRVVIDGKLEFTSVPKKQKLIEKIEGVKKTL